MIRMSQQQMDELKPLNEEHTIVIQAVCQQQLDDVINVLFGLVLASEMPQEAKDNLLSGISHISAHLHSEMRELTAEVGGRPN
jgi:hypothetical protein